MHLAGQIGAGETIAEQFEAALANLLLALSEAGGKPDDLVSLQVYTTDINAYKAALPALGGAWQRHFGRHYPAMGLFGVTGLFERGAMVEVMGTAVLQST